jgi:VanZ family protein
MSSKYGAKPANAFVRWAAITAFAAGIVVVSVLSLTPGDVLPAIDVWDKLQHVLAYLALAVTGGVAFSGGHRLSRLAIGLLILGGTLEALQGLVPGRVVSFGDAVANAIGVALGLAIARIVGRRWHFG